MPILTRTDRLRRVVIVCSSFVRNLGYYRAGWHETAKHLLTETATHASFWRQMNSNSLDVAVLEWCKLFIDRQGEHCWRRIVADEDKFKAALLDRLKLTADQFQQHCETMRGYRNKFVAHLDTDATMNIPMLDVADAAARFYHEHVVTKEAKPGELSGLADTPEKLRLGFKQCVDEARAVFGSAARGPMPVGF
jgi:hypothetical protein